MSKMISKLSVAMLFVLFATVSVQAAKVSAYFDAPYQSASAVKANLKKAGFQVLATYSPAKHSEIKVMVITNSSLKAMAAKKTRGFAAIQRVSVNSKSKVVRTTNPQYWLPAFLQGDYNAGKAKAVTAALKKALGSLKGTKHQLASGDLKGYHFMIGMPYYDDMLEFKGKSSVKGNKALFTLKLANGSTLVGVKMSSAAEGFINKIGDENALLLPYTVLLEGGNAYALHAKYYLAISYPLLSMGDFMGISSIPDTIERSVKKTLK